MDNPDEMLPVVDERGRPSGTATRQMCHSGSMLLHPVVHLHIFDPGGNLFLQKRPDWKDVQPGRWDTAVGGHMDPGETVAGALRREALEELGIDIAAIEGETTSHPPYIFTSERERELVNPFSLKLKSDTPIAPSSETAGGRFWTADEIRHAMGQGILTPNFEQEYARLFAASAPTGKDNA